MHAITLLFVKTPYFHSFIYLVKIRYSCIHILIHSFNNFFYHSCFSYFCTLTHSLLNIHSEDYEGGGFHFFNQNNSILFLEMFEYNLGLNGSLTGSQMSYIEWQTDTEEQSISGERTYSQTEDESNSESWWRRVF